MALAEEFPCGPSRWERPREVIGPKYSSWGCGLQEAKVTSTRDLSAQLNLARCLWLFCTLGSLLISHQTPPLAICVFWHVSLLWMIACKIWTLDSQCSMVSRSSGFGSRCHLEAVWTWVHYLTFLSYRLLICKVVIIVVLNSEMSGKANEVIYGKCSAQYRCSIYDS